MAKEAGAKRIRRQKKSPPVVKKETATSELSIDSLEAYDRVLSCGSAGKLYLCSVVDLQNVLKANALQISYLRKEYIEQHFSMLSKVLFQTRFSSLITENSIVAMALENSEVAQDVSALQWQDGESKNLVISPQTHSEEMKVSLGGLAVSPAAEFSAGMKCPQHVYTSPLSIYPKDGTTDLIELSVDDCYHPDMSMIETPNFLPSFCQDPASPSMCMPVEMCLLHPQEEEYHMDSPTFGQKEEPVTQPLMLSLFCEEQLSQSSTTGSLSPAVSEPDGEVVDSCSSLNHTAMASAEVSDDRFEAEAEAEQILDHEGVLQVRVQEQYSLSSGPHSSSEEVPVQPCSPLSQLDHTVFASETRYVMEGESGDESDHSDMLVLEALELNVLHSLLSGDELSSIEMPHGMASEGSSPFEAEIVSKSAGVEEDSSDKSCPKEEWLQHAEQDSSLPMMSSPQDALPLSVTPASPQTTTAEFSSLSFLDLLAHVSSAHSGSLKHEQCVRHCIGSTSCAKRLFMEDEAESPAEENDMAIARSPKRYAQRF